MLASCRSCNNQTWRISCFFRIINSMMMYLRWFGMVHLLWQYACPAKTQFIIINTLHDSFTWRIVFVCKLWFRWSSTRLRPYYLHTEILIIYVLGLHWGINFPNTICFSWFGTRYTGYLILEDITRGYQVIESHWSQNISWIDIWLHQCWGYIASLLFILNIDDYTRVTTPTCIISSYSDVWNVNL